MSISPFPNVIATLEQTVSTEDDPKAESMTGTDRAS